MGHKKKKKTKKLPERSTKAVSRKVFYNHDGHILKKLEEH